MSGPGPRHPTPTRPCAEVLADMFHDVWGPLTHLDLLRAGPTAGGFDGVTALLHISGAWTGTVLFQCATPLVARASRSMLGLSEGTPPSPADMRDVAGEIGNVLGGRLKASLPGPSLLSLPVVVDGQVLDDKQQLLPASKLVAQVAFESEGLPMLVSLWKSGEQVAK
jgi:hypothetical protein